MKKIRLIQKSQEKETAPSQEKVRYVIMKTAGGYRKIIIKPPKPKPEKGIKTGYAYPFPPFMQMEGMSAEEKKREEEKRKIDGIAVPEIITERTVLPSMDVQKINIKYSLIPKQPKQGDRIYAYAHIYWEKDELVYHIIEPAVSEEQRKLLNEIKEYIQEKIDIDFVQLKGNETRDYITDIFDNALDYFKIRIVGDTRDILRYYILRDFLGLESIEPLLNDPRIEDISCDGIGIPLYVYHRDPNMGSLRTNIMFKTKEELDLFASKLAERCGKNLSVARPMLDGTLPDGSRVQATLGSDIARQGSNFTIRMFTEEPFTPIDFIKIGTVDIRIMAYFWFLVEHGSSVLVSGGTATGKTSMLNVLSLFIKPQMKIISIEDTSELRLPHPHWVPEVARVPMAEMYSEGKVDMYELLRNSLRQRPDYIIVGEVRGHEAYVLFQQMAVGHTGLATIHAENYPKLIDRLTTKPISLPMNLLENLDVVVFLKRVREKGGRYIRRTSSVIEMCGYDREKDILISNELFKWDPRSDGFVAINKSAILKKVADGSGLDYVDVQNDIKKRAKVLKWMIDKNIRDYRKVSGVINLFYISPDYLLERIDAEMIV
ncbi:MAG: type II/IV secretion system ATPase subunit [Candidatus Aenigmarchaeota archaeon]|nr:type II/IV secretion system ATPase subunit [Candidatus Aenigmarchaeota archaeon]